MSKKTVYSYKFYRLCYLIIGPILLFFRPIAVHGKENLISGAAVVCANHSAMIDPFLVALSFNVDSPIHVLAKEELFRIPVVAFFLRKLGKISVDRKKADISSVKASINYLKNNEKILIFPEGTRAMAHNEVVAKSGAIRIAERTGAPVIPVYIPRKKPFFIRSKLVYGKPYLIEKMSEKRTAEDYEKLADELMSKIQELGTAS